MNWKYADKTPTIGSTGQAGGASAPLGRKTLQDHVNELDPAMKMQIFATLLTICLASDPPSIQADQVPNEDNCRKAITAGLEQLKRIPPDITQRDDEARKKLLTDMELLIETNRRHGVSECRTWTDMMKKAFNQ